MQNFDYQRRTYVLFGRGRENEVGSLVKFEGGRRVLLHYGDDAQRKPDLIDRIKRALDRAGLEFFELGGVATNPEVGLVYQGIDFCRQMQIDFVLAIGQSAVIDSAKAICAGATYQGDFWDFFSGLREPVRAEILNWLQCDEKDLSIPLSYTLLSNAVLLVEAGLGCAFCLDGALAIYSSPQLRFIPISPERTTRSVLVWKKDRLFSPASSLFIQEVNMLRAALE